MADDAGEKTEPASEKRREEYREKGEIARSRDVLSVLVLFCALAYFFFFGGWLFRSMGRFMVQYCGMRPNTELRIPDVVHLGHDTVIEMALIIAPLAVMVIVVSIGGSVAQVGFLFTAKPLTPDLNRLNIFTRFFSTFFNKQALGNLVGSSAKIAIVALVIYLTVSGEGRHIRAISTLPLFEGVSYLLERCLLVLFNVTLVLIVIAIADYAWNRYVMEEKMKMTRQEVKDEQKEYEGNPHVKGQMRRRALDIAQKRMMQAVPKADVVVNNPTHIAVALRYRQGHDAAPVVLAKGADLMALRIRRIAKAHDIPMVENKPLARGLYRGVKVGRPVPSQFYRAVAEVLAYVYRLRRTRVVRPAPAMREVRDVVRTSRQA